MFLKVNHNDRIKKLRFSEELKDFKNFVRTIQDITGFESSELIMNFVDNEKEILPINDKLDFDYFLADASENKFKEVFVTNKLNEDKIYFVNDQEVLANSFKKLEAEIANLNWKNESTPVSNFVDNQENYVYKLPEIPSQKKSLAYYQGIEEFTTRNPLTHACETSSEQNSSHCLKPITLKPIELNSDDESPVIKPINMNLREKGRKVYYKGLEDFIHREEEECNSFRCPENENKSIKKEVIHSHVICDVCGVHNITGKRFKCMVCPNFDICENCEKNNEHELHPMIKCSQIENEHVLGKICKKYGKLKKRHERKLKTQEKLRKLRDLVNPRNLKKVIRQSIEPNIRRAVESFNQRTSPSDELKQETSIMLIDESSLMREERERLQKEKKEMLKFIFGEAQMEIIEELINRFDQLNMEEMLNEVMKYNNIIEQA